MALSDIIETLKKAADHDLAEITAARQSDIASIDADFAAYVTKRTVDATSDRERRVSKVKGRILAKARHHANFIATGAIQKDVELVFQATEKILADLPDSEYVTFLEQQWSTLPPSTATTTFIVAAERAASTITFLTKKGIAESAISTSNGLLGGFIYQTPTKESDHSFSGLLQHLRATKTIEVSQQLTA